MGEIIAFDPKTGEVLGQLQATVKPRGRRTITMMYGPNWLAVPIAAGKRLSRRRALTRSAHEVLWFMLGEIEPDNHIRVRASEIAQSIGMQRTQVHRAINELRAAEIIVDRDPYGFRLHPEFGYRGDPTNKVAKLRDGSLTLIGDAP